MNTLPDKKKWNRTSASQIKTFQRCKVKWIWEKLYGFRGPGSRATQRGQLIHKMIEDALGHAIPPGQGEYEKIDTNFLTADDWNRAPAIALKMMEHIHLEPGAVPSNQIEHVMNWKPEGSPVYLFGFVDLVDGPQKDGSLLITDHKTRSRIGKYTPTAAELRYDTQGICYGAYAEYMAPEPCTVRFRHLNGQTTGTIISTEVIASWDPGEVSRLFNEKVLPDILGQRETADLDDPLKVIQGNMSACKDFGGCEHIDRCKQQGIVQKSDPFAAISGLKETEKMGALDWLMKPKAEKVEAEKVVVPVATAEFAFAVGDAVATATGVPAKVVTRFSAPNGNPAYKLSDGNTCYEYELTAAVAVVEDTPSVPDSVPNPPDGVPMDEEVTVADVAAEKAKTRTRGFKVFGKNVSSLAKAEANRVHAALTRNALFGPEYTEVTKRPTEGKVTLAETRADIALIFQVLQLKDQTEEDIVKLEGPLGEGVVVVGMPCTNEPGDTARRAFATGEIGRTIPSRALGDHVPVSYESPGILAEAQAELRRLEAENTRLRAARGSRVLYVNCRPGHPVAQFTYSEKLVQKFKEAHEGTHPMIWKDYSITGWAKMAVALSDADLPSELYIDLGEMGMREALVILRPMFDVVVQS